MAENLAEVFKHDIEDLDRLRRRNLTGLLQFIAGGIVLDVSLFADLVHSTKNNTSVMSSYWLIPEAIGLLILAKGVYNSVTAMIQGNQYILSCKVKGS